MAKARPFYIVLHDDKNPGRFAVAELDWDANAGEAATTYSIICRDIGDETTAGLMVEAFEAYAKKHRGKPDDGWRF